jgi:hypothetical protein
MDIETELLICMKEQGFTDTIDDKTIAFPLRNIIKMWDILKEENNGNV